MGGGRTGRDGVGTSSITSQAWLTLGTHVSHSPSCTLRTCASDSNLKPRAAGKIQWGHPARAPRAAGMSTPGSPSEGNLADSLQKGLCWASCPGKCHV